MFSIKCEEGTTFLILDQRDEDTWCVKERGAAIYQRFVYHGVTRGLLCTPPSPKWTKKLD